MVHAKATGGAALPGGANYALGFANQFKLHHKYDDAAIARAASVAFVALADDALAKRRRIRELGLLAAQGEGARGC